MGSNSSIKNHFPDLQDLTVPKNGFVYIYCSNESPVKVFFDNLQVVHTRGQILEETHYYPFGLTMAGISSKAADKLESKKKFLGQELENDFGFNCYQFKFRNHDPQIGRFIEIDPLATKYTHNSTYAYSENRVIDGFDLEGKEFCRYDCDSYDPGVKQMADWDHVSNYRNSKNYQIFNAARNKWSGDGAIVEGMGWALGGEFLGMGFKYFFGLVKSSGAGSAIINTGLKVWEMIGVKRGFEIERFLGANLPKNFPIIDKFINGVATSIKSLDVTAKSYLKDNSVFNTLKGYVDKVADFEGASYAGASVKESEISSKVLELAIEPGKATFSQWEQISKAVNYAKENDVQFNIRFIK